MTRRNSWCLFLLVANISIVTSFAQSLGRTGPNEIKQYVDHLHKIAADSYFQGNYSKAISSAEAAVELYSTYCDTTDLEYASYLSDWAYYLYSYGDCDQAVKYEKKAFEIRDPHRVSNIIEYATSLAHFCDYYGDLEEYDTALAYGEQAVSLLRDSGNDSLFIYALESLIYNCISADNLEKAESLLLEATAWCQGSYLNKTTISGLLFIHWGYLYYNLGRFSLALDYTLKGLQVLELSVGKKHPHYAYALHNAGMVYCRLGDFASAIECFKECLSIRKNVYGIDNPNYIITLANLGVVYEYMGDIHLAKETTNKAVVLDELLLGKNNIQYCLDLADVARHNHILGNNKEAIELQSQVVNIERTITGKNDHYYALGLLSLSTYYSAEGDYEGAEKLAIDGLQIIENAKGKDGYWSSRFYRSLADIYSSKNDYNNAINSINKALLVLRQHNGNNSLEYADALLKKISIDFSVENVRVDDIIEYDDYLHSVVAHSFCNMTKAEREKFWRNNNSWFLDQFPKIVSSHPNDTLAARLYNNILLSKGLTLYSGIELKRGIMASESPTAQQSFSDLSQVNRQIEMLLKLPITERYLSVDSLISQRESLEQKLNKNSKLYSSFKSKLNLSWQSVQRALSKEEIAIEFVEVPINNQSEYYALIIDAFHKSPQIKRLFSDAELKAIKRDSYYVSTKLYELVWEKLADYLSSTTTVYFSPSGVLHKIAIEYAVRADGQRFSELFITHRLSSTREILEKKPFSSGGEVALFGGIHYDRMTDDRLKADSAISVVENESIRGGFSFLPATEKECESIQAILSSKYTVRFYSGEGATESLFKSFSGKAPRYIHIATHGFYWSADDIRKEHLDYDFLLSENDSQVSYEQRVLSHSGLLFYGANQTLKEGKTTPLSDDGILTSNEISNIDLDGTDLLVLSACQTGLGDISADEVYGLQRGFKAAGVRTIIMSLWEVDDYATGLLMKKFYEYLNKNISPSESLRMAQHYVENYNGVIRVNGEKVHVNYSDPKYWAAFIVLDGI